MVIICFKGFNVICYVFRNPSSGSGLSETGSLDRGKAALERRKKAAEEGGSIGGRVEVTRVNPDSLIEQLIRASNLEHTDAESKPNTLMLFYFRGNVCVCVCVCVL